MKNLFILCLSMFTCACMSLVKDQEFRHEGNKVLKGIPENIPEKLKEHLSQYQNTRGHAFRDWAHGGKGLFIGTRFAETSQVHQVRGPGKARQQMTFFDEPTQGAQVNPSEQHNGFLFSMDREGNERNQYYYYDINTGQHRLLSDGSNIHLAGNWDRSGQKFFYSSNRRNGKDFDIYRAPLKTPKETELILEGDGAWYNGHVSFDNTQMLVMNYVSSQESYYYILDLESLEKEQIHPVEHNVSYGSARFSADNSGVFIVSDEHSEFRRLHYYDIETQQMHTITEDLEWDIESLSTSDDGKKLAFSVNAGGQSEVYLMNPESFEYQRIEGVPTGIVSNMGFDPEGRRLAMTINTSRSPSDVYVLNLDDHSIEQWTFAEVGGLKKDSFVTPELIHFPTFDEDDNKARMIPSYFFSPRDGEPHPVLIDIHGGPASQYRPYFRPFTQYLVNELGIAVLGPNVRGSTGYGKSYEKLDDKELREDSVKDIGYLLKWIEQNPDLDENRIAVIGGSYGGYMVYSSLIHFNQKIRAGISLVGIANFVTFLENTGEYRVDLRREEYGDERNPQMREFLKRISPTKRADEIQSPSFILHGANDPRVPASEAELMLESISENDIEVWYLLAKDEGHGFRRKSNRDYAHWAYVLFLKKHLLKP